MRKIWNWLLPWILQNLIKKKKKKNLLEKKMFVQSGFWQCCSWFGSRVFSAPNWVQSSFVSSNTLYEKNTGWSLGRDLDRLCAATQAHANLSKCIRVLVFQLSLLSCFLHLGPLWLPDVRRAAAPEATLCSTTKQANAHTKKPDCCRCCGCGEVLHSCGKGTKARSKSQQRSQVLLGLMWLRTTVNVQFGQKCCRRCHKYN